ncbi:hypothetical protein FS837_011437 [Tulasnella sp. UAMH 9824]|nr:hypothetical protein FS837_011437 [Tulasnella sp. UAMH 9824]
MSPINTLPFDVFQIIITSCWEEKGESFALTASHVCRLWRHHVLDMPLLWNRLEFATGAPKWDMLEVRLQRSGQASLDIVVEEEVFLKSGMPHLRRIMQMIVPHIERWRSLRIVDVPHKVRRVLLDQLRGKSVPLLHRVEVVQERKYDRTWGRRIKSTSPHWNCRKIFDGAPNLRHLEWANPEAEYRLLPPFQNLLTLTIGHGTLDIEPDKFIQLVFRVLSASPALQVLSLPHGPDSDWGNDEDAENTAQSPIIHPSLKVLRIDSATSVRSVILRSLILPELQSLGEPFSDAEVDISCCKAIAESNSAPKLRGVIFAGKLNGNYSSNPAFHPHIPSLPSAIMNLHGLVVLVLRFVDFGGNNKWLPNLGNCCPRLKSFMLMRCVGYTVKAIRDMVETRMKHEEVEALEELRIVTGYGEQDGKASDEEAAWFSQVLRFNSRENMWYNVDRYDL